MSFANTHHHCKGPLMRKTQKNIRAGVLKSGVLQPNIELQNYLFVVDAGLLPHYQVVWPVGCRYADIIKNQNERNGNGKQVAYSN